MAERQGTHEDFPLIFGQGPSDPSLDPRLLVATHLAVVPFKFNTCSNIATRLYSILDVPNLGTPAAYIATQIS